MADAPIVAQIVISVDSTGYVSVQGPVNNRMLCYGMLETAKDVVFEYAQQAAKGVQPASASDIATLSALNAAQKRGGS